MDLMFILRYSKMPTMMKLAGPSDYHRHYFGGKQNKSETQKDPRKLGSFWVG
jgi:hypothetical protein